MLLKYGHYGYPRKEHEKTNSTVKELSDFDVWSKSYDQKNFGFFPYILPKQSMFEPGFCSR